MSSLNKPRAKFIYYFCDETSFHDTHMAVGGLAVPDYNLAPITAELRNIKTTKNIRPEHEIKWEKTSERHDCGETAYANYLAELLTTKKVHLHVRFAPFTEYNHHHSGPNRRADTVGKMHYQLLLHRAVRFYGGAYKLRIRPDAGDCTKKLCDQQGALLYEAVARHRYEVQADCIDSIEPRDSVREPLLQLLDVTLGALTAMRNGRHLRPECAEPKKALALHVHGLHGHADLNGNTGPLIRHFSIWNAVPEYPKLLLARHSGLGR